ALEEQTSGVDLVLGVALSHGLGYGLGNAVMPLPSPNACFWGGWGGSTILVDFDQGLALSYVMNRMEGDLLGDVRGGLLTAAVYQSLAQGA
ncbi:MAG: serine hydrolase, partial [Acidobacteriota bacterium]